MRLRSRTSFYKNTLIKNEVWKFQRTPWIIFKDFSNEDVYLKQLDFQDSFMVFPQQIP
jgi:hypothetical protein